MITMKKLLISLLALLPLLLIPLDSYADKDKGPSDRAYDRANDNASFKRDNDKKKHDDKDKQKKKKHHKDDDDHKDKDKDKDKKKDKKKDGKGDKNKK